MNSDGQFATATSNLQPSPNLTANVSVSGGQFPHNASAQAYIIYAFFIDPLAGGADGVEVPIFISAAGGVSPTSFLNTASIAQGSIGNPTYNLLATACTAGDAACGSLPSSFSINTLVPLTSGVAWVIEISLSLSAFSGDTVSGYVDPILTIDPHWDFASDYQLVFSEGVGNGPVSAVPLPAALPLFAGGLGLMGWMARRRRGQVVHA